ncbi:hypothetical protein NLI96_g5861 [Meripilus lineatus]|uniref:non-specific serine/threonine protein kinase n=1 Tax=Meripilus lineatus TaxID=2056292 RepID=A0AAD5V271_9APHY|nr:hypothetical protein NLI96_g5861 [Physisporinus lineatus]
MLGTKTKQVNSYGRRGRRVVNVSSDQKQGASSNAAEQEKEYVQQNVVPDLAVNAPIVVRTPVRKRSNLKAIPLSPLSSPASSQRVRPARKYRVSPKVSKPAPIVSARRPLGALVANIPSTPSRGRRKNKSNLEKPAIFKPNSPIVDVEIITLDRDGRRVNHERRISRTDVRITPSNVRPFQNISDGDAILVSDSEDESQPVRRPKRTGGRKAPIIISSDDESDTKAQQAKPSKHKSPLKRRNIVISLPSSPEGDLVNLSTRDSPIPVPHPGRSKQRTLTPIRARAGDARTTARPVSPPSPTPSTDLDDSLVFDLAQLDLSPAILRQLKKDLSIQERIPPYLLPLLEECGQSTPYEFSAFIEMFPHDPIVGTSHDGVSLQGPSQAHPSFQKIGEASYSEVFGIGDVVLKIIPLRDEEATFVEDDNLDTPAPSDAKDVLREMIVTKALGEIQDQFTQLLRTYVVRGKYPSALLDLWDEYDERKGSESIRPNGFNVSQLYAIIVLPNGGPDLEAFVFSTPKARWSQACSLFWQVTRALAEVEDLVQFEHRDLHWGQILVKEFKPSRNSSKRPKGSIYPMDHERHGVKATIIDLGLARMNTHDRNKHKTHWTPFEDEVFEGRGDYQFDIYRMMKLHNGGDWVSYHPFTNVMWLHYLTHKLLHAKGLPRPVQRKTTKPAAVRTTYTEAECYQCLVEVESILSTVVAPLNPPPVVKGRRKTQAPIKLEMMHGPRSAGDVLRLGVERRWVD